MFELFLNCSYNVLTPYYILQLYLICSSVCNVSCGCFMLMLSSLGIFKRERERERERERAYLSAIRTRECSSSRITC